MKFEIRNRFTSVIIFSLECETFQICVNAAIKSKVRLYGANLSGANLYRADLSGTDLSRADLYRANLYRANLSGTDLSGANLSGANLSVADLSMADLSGASLSGTDLYRADLSGANLSGTDLYEANLSGANLSGTDISMAKNVDLVFAKQKICPPEGAFVGWKKLKDNVIARLVIPHDAERMNALGSRKCRASKAIVRELFGADEGFDKHTGKLRYVAGAEVVPDKYDPDVRVECSSGIHFFITREEAEAY